MAWTDLKAAVAAVVKTNGTQAITGALLQSTLGSIIDQVGANATFKGVATPTTAPGAPDGPIFYLAVEKGVYSNFGGIEIDAITILSNQIGYWVAYPVLKVTQTTGTSETAVMSQKAVSNEFASLRSDLSEAITALEQEQIQGGIYDVSYHNDGAVFESLSVLLGSASLSTLIPTSVRRGGMSIRFIQGSVPNSDNKYVQYRLTSNTFTTTASEWQKQGAEVSQNTRTASLSVGNENIGVAKSNNLEYIDSMIGYELKAENTLASVNIFNGLSIKAGDMLYIKVTDATGYSRIVINYNGNTDKRIVDSANRTDFIDNWMAYLPSGDITQIGIVLFGVDTASLYVKKESMDEMPYANGTKLVKGSGIYSYIDNLVGFKYESRFVTSPVDKLINNLGIKQGDKISIGVFCESYTRILVNYNGDSSSSRLADTNDRTDFINNFIEVTAPTDIWCLGLHVSDANAKLIVQRINYDKEPKQGSFNFVKSGGVYSYIDNLVGTYKEGIITSDKITTTLITDISIANGETFFLKVVVGDYTRYVINYNGNTDNRLADTDNAVVAENGWTEFKAPANITMLGIALFGTTDGCTLCYAKVKPTLIKNTDALSKKKWYVCGDSFSYDSWNSHTNDNTFIDEPYKGRFKIYPYWIGRRVDIEVHNIASGGMSMCANRSDGTDNSFTASGTEHHTIPLYQTIPADADIITLYLGINDNNYGCPLGEWGDTSNQTFYGAWKLALDWLVENRPNAKIGIVITNGSAPRFTNAERIIAKKYGIPYLDMELDVERVPYLLRQYERTVSGGGDMLDSVAAAKDEEHAVDWGTNNHPTAKCHELESTIIENWLRTL